MGFSTKDSRADSAPQFQPCQIVCLEHENTHLYGEVIQIVEARKLCWARSLALVIGSPEAHPSTGTDPEKHHWFDLRQGADLLLPMVLFRPALDTEVVPLLSRLYASPDSCENTEQIGRQRLNQLVRQVCQAYPDAFQ